MTTINVYGCGGAATNIIHALQQEMAHSKAPECFAKMEVYYLDSSRSNLLDKQVPAERLFLLEGVDGSGKVRAQNHEAVAREGKAMLQRFKPGTFNIVVHSAGGGTGSVIGPILVKEMMDKGLFAISIVIGNQGSKQELENTIKTLQTYEALAERVLNRCTVLHYVESDNCQKADLSVKNAAGLLAALFSGRNHGLDSQDLKHWLAMEKMCNIAPRAVSLHFANTVDDLSKLSDVLSLATLVPAEISPAQAEEIARVPFAPVYHTTGKIANVPVDDATGAPRIPRPLHYALSVGYVAKILSPLQAKLAQINESLAALNHRSSIVSGDTAVSATGLVL